MRLLLAPMEGVVNHLMRDQLTRSGSLDRCVTEFVRVTERLLPDRVFHRWCPELASGGTTPSGTPVYLQLLGGRPGPMAENAARVAELGAPGVDINFGCPAKTVNRSDGGSVLLREPQRLYDIVGAVRRAVPPATPVTVKIRLGFEDSSLLEDNVRGIAAAGANELVVHARTRRHGYRPPAYWDEVARVRSWVDLPVVANGEVWTTDDATRCRAQSGCADLMLGRGLLRQPDLAEQLRAAQAGEQFEPLAWPAVLPRVEAFFAAVVAHYDPPAVGNPLKQWLGYLRGQYAGAQALFEQVKRLRRAEEIWPVLHAARGATGS